jgi:hypothetical protein
VLHQQAGQKAASDTLPILEFNASYRGGVHRRVIARVTVISGRADSIRKGISFLAFNQKMVESGYLKQEPIGYKGALYGSWGTEYEFSARDVQTGDWKHVAFGNANVDFLGGAISNPTLKIARIPPDERGFLPLDDAIYQPDGRPAYVVSPGWTRGEAAFTALAVADIAVVGARAFLASSIGRGVALRFAAATADLPAVSLGGLSVREYSLTVGRVARTEIGEAVTLAVETGKPLNILTFRTTDAVKATGKNAGAKALNYEANIRKAFYGDTPLAERKFQILVDNKLVTREADALTENALGQGAAVEVKYTSGWKYSPYNPASAAGKLPKGLDAQARFVTQAQTYAKAFRGGITYHTNSKELARHYTSVLQKASVTDFHFLITPVKR